MYVVMFVCMDKCILKITLYVAVIYFNSINEIFVNIDVKETYSWINVAYNNVLAYESV